MSFATDLDCSLNCASLCGVRFFLKIDSNLDLLDLAIFISGVIKGLWGRERQEVVFCGA